MQFIILSKMALTFESVNDIPKRFDLNDSYYAVLPCGTMSSLPFKRFTPCHWTFLSLAWLVTKGSDSTCFLVECRKK